VEEKEIQDELSAIRGLMERSSKFISLSGLSGILAGVYALAGALFAYLLIYDGSTRIYVSLSMRAHPQIIYELIAIAMLVLILSIATGIILSSRKAKSNGQSIWGKTSKALLFHMAIPLITGGLLSLIFISRGYYGIISASTLIFYGLALVSASNFTFTDVKYLGLLEIALGLLAACFPGYGLLFWALGFGVLHIIYGSMMYLKYDR
jgi:uncharacterized membrane protein